ncbi:MAG TPA: S9 family peptidase [Anaerolineae bacterium]|nr:S9 family peptidase [Anaerolineae bacterium]HQI86068.1 S9 family peptidase [Anaerolineae bacterium]
MPSTSKITLEDVARYPLPGMAIPNTFAFSADDTLLTYLHSAEGTLTQQLYACDPATGAARQFVFPPTGGETEETLSLEEKLRRERARSLVVGVTRYALSGQGSRVLVPLNGGIYVQNSVDAPLRQIVGNDGGPALDPQFSPDGNFIAYVRDAELYVVSAEGGESVQVTAGARGAGCTHGLAEYIAQEEMGRSHGFWWSPDGRWLAFAEVDETHIPVYRIVHQGQDHVGEGAQEDHRYPFAGQANATVRLGVVSAYGGARLGDRPQQPVWMNLGEDDDIYLARVQWFSDGCLVAQIEDREQTELRLLCFDPQTGASETILTETSDVWINLHDLLTPLKDGRFVWAAERTGFRHLYLYDSAGQLIRQLTDGPWMVDTLAGVDEANGWVYFTATQAHPTEQHLYVVSLDGGDVRQITREPGMHAVTLDHARRRFVDVHSAPETPPTVTLRDLADGALLRVIYDTPDPRVAALELPAPQIVAFQNCNGDMLYGALYFPPAEYGPGPYPVIVSVYGGPHAQRVTRNWALTVDMHAQYLSSLGFLVLKVDNRGSARRGLAFEGALKHNMGDVEVQDQVDGVKWLVAQGLADPARVGIYGWSYGGYMAAMCLARAPETFKVAVAGAPVTHWDGYDTHYTERYMGTPQSNPAGYATSSVMAHVDKIQGKLLLVHGLIDENVHFRHTARLINALIHARKPYELLLFPDERHTPRRVADRIYMEERISDFFLENL